MSGGCIAGYRHIRSDVHNNVKRPALLVQRWFLVTAALILLMRLTLLNVDGPRLAFETWP